MRNRMSRIARPLMMATGVGHAVVVTDDGAVPVASS